MAKYIELIDKYRIEQGDGEYNPPSYVWVDNTGEIVRCRECIHFTQGGWCDREFDWFSVDENDFCSMAEKTEAQE